MTTKKLDPVDSGIFEERTALLAEPTEEDLSEDLESVELSLDDISLSESDLIATGGFRISKPRPIPASFKEGTARAQKVAQKAARSKGEATGDRPKRAPRREVAFDNLPWAPRAKAMLGEWLPKIDDVELVRAHLVNHRLGQKRMWRGHAKRFGSKQDLPRTIAASAILKALDTVPIDKLIAVELRADKRFFLVWIDLQEERLVAVVNDLKVT